MPEASGARPRPAALKITPLIVSVDLPVSLKVSLRSSPFSRLMPLKDASCAVVVICVMMLLYWATRLARMVCEAASASRVAGGAAGGRHQRICAGAAERNGVRSCRRAER